RRAVPMCSAPRTGSWWMCARAGSVGARYGCSARPGSGITTRIWTTGRRGWRWAISSCRGRGWGVWAIPATPAARRRTCITASTAPMAPTTRCRCCWPPRPGWSRRMARVSIGVRPRAAWAGVSMGKRFWVCGIVVAMAALVFGFVIHGLLLRGDYLAHAALYRSQAEASARFPWIMIAYALIGFSMTWLYQRLHEGDQVHLREGL